MSEPRPAAGILAWISPALAWAFLLLVAWGTTASAYAPRDLAVLALVYLLIAVALVAGARALQPLGIGGAVAGALVVGFVLAWHLREQVRVEGAGATLWTAQGLLEFLPWVLGLAAAFGVLEALTRRRRAEGSVARPLVVWAATTVAFLLLVGVSMSASDTLRWHLLRHNRMVGSVAFLLYGRPVAEIEAEDWREHGRGAPIGQPAWVQDLYTNRVADPDGRDAPEGDSAATEPASPPAQPTIVFVMLDTLRRDGLRPFGGEPDWMPALSDFADANLLFTDVIANSSWTRPSIASFFTGLPQEEHGALSFEYSIAPGALTLAEVLGATGYLSAAFVANSVIVDPASGYQRGFDLFEYVDDPPRDYARAGVLTDRVAAWLAERGPPAAETSEDGAPLFLYVHYFDPHIPYMSTPAEGAEILPSSNDGIWRYYSDELRYLDGEVARLLDVLDAELPGARLLLIASDHGEEFGEHDGMGHSQTLYSEVVDIPVIVQARDGAGPPPAALLDAPLEGRDFFDLMLRTGVEGPLDVPSWAAAAAREDRFASLSFTKNPGRSRLVHALVRPYRHHIYNRLVQRGDRRLIWSAFGDTDELYDLSADPGERFNIARRHPELVRELRDLLDVTPPYWVRLAPVDLSPARIEELRALGYIR